METDTEAVPSDRLGLAGALVTEFLNRSGPEPVRQLSHLLIEALDLLRPLTTGSSMDPAAVRLANWIHQLRHDWANAADLCQRFLDQNQSFEDRSIATLQLVLALTALERHEDAVAAHRTHIKCVMAHRPASEWADTMWNSTIASSWGQTGKDSEWIELFRAVGAGTAPTPENRESRYELLHTAMPHSRRLRLRLWPGPALLP